MIELTPTLSIIVPALDEAACIESTLRALTPARDRGAQIIVVDGGSSDATVALARPWADQIITAPRGRALQLNAGAKTATGRILWFLHADSIPEADADLAIVTAMGDRELGWGRFDIAIDSTRRTLRLVAAMMNLRSRATGIATGDQGLFVTRALFDRIGGYPRQPLMEDIAFCRIARQVQRPVNLDHRVLTSGRRWERNGVARTIVLMWRLRSAYFFGADPSKLAALYERNR